MRCDTCGYEMSLTDDDKRDGRTGCPRMQCRGSLVKHAYAIEVLREAERRHAAELNRHAARPPIGSIAVADIEAQISGQRILIASLRAAIAVLEAVNE